VGGRIGEKCRDHRILAHACDLPMGGGTAAGDIYAWLMHACGCLRVLSK
jgi:hypothetical protein